MIPLVPPLDFEVLLMGIPHFIIKLVLVEQKLTAISNSNDASNRQIAKKCVFDMPFWVDADSYDPKPPVSRIGFQYKKFPGKCLKEEWPKLDDFADGVDEKNYKDKKREVNGLRANKISRRDIFLRSNEFPDKWQEGDKLYIHWHAPISIAHSVLELVVILGS